MVVGRQRCRLDRTVVTRRCTRSQEMDGVSQRGKLVTLIIARMKGSLLSTMIASTLYRPFSKCHLVASILIKPFLMHYDILAN